MTLMLAIAGAGVITIVNISENWVEKGKYKEVIIEEIENVKEIPVSQIVKEINKANKLIVLEGITNNKVTYTDRKIEEEDVNFKWLKEKINILRARDLAIDAEYKYGFSYNMLDLPLKYADGEYSLVLSWNRLDLEYLEPTDNFSLQDKLGIFSKGDFTPGEINSLLNRTKELSKNSIRNKRDLRDKALDQVKLNIESIANKLGITINITYAKHDVEEKNYE